jgi:hypothetical protein
MAYLIFRKAESEDDVEQLCLCEMETNTYNDPDFGLVPKPWYWTEEDFYRAIRQRKDEGKGTNDTRILVTSVPRDPNDDNSDEWVCGGIIFELGQVTYDIVYLGFSPAAPEAARQRMLNYLTKRARIYGRQAVTMSVPDGQDHILAFLVKYGFKANLRRGGFDGMRDTWECSYDVEDSKGIEKGTEKV